MPRRAVPPTLPWAQSPVFADGQAGGIDIGAALPTIEIVPDAMVTRVLPAPGCMGCQRQQAARESDKVIPDSRSS